MLTVLAALGVLIVIFVAAVVATREGHGLADAPGDVADVGLPGGPLQPEDVHAVRFGVVVRGYRMSEVDEVLERVARELADRDERIALLVAAAEPAAAATPAAPASPATAVTPTAVQTAPVVPAAAVPVAPVVPAEPPLDGPPATLQAAPESTPPAVEVATVPVELAPLPNRTDDSEDSSRG